MATREQIQAELDKRNGAPSRYAIMAEIEKRKSAEPKEEKGMLESATDYAEGLTRSIAQGATWNQGDKLIAGLASVGSYPFTGEPVSDAYKRLVVQERDMQGEFKEESPVSATVGEIGGAIAGGGALAKSAGLALPKLSGKVLEQVGKNIGTKTLGASTLGGLSASTYELGGEPRTSEKRIEDVTQAGAMGAGFGPVGVIAAPLVGRLASKVASPITGTVESLTDRARNLFGAKPVTRLSNEIVESRGGEFPLSKGQLTQNGESQSMENMARAGALGSKPQQIMQEFDVTQQNQIQDYMSKMGADSQEVDSLSGAGKMVKDAYSDIKKGVSNAYDDAKIIGETYVNKAPISETLVPQVKQMLKDEAFDVQYYSPKSQNLISQITNSKYLNDPKVTSLNMGKLESWRKRVNRAIEDGTELGKMNEEALVLTKVKSQFDNFMSELPRDALKSGDSSSIEAIIKARSLRAEQGKKFDRVSVVKDIVRNDELTNEELANMVLAGSKRSEKINSSSGRLVKDLKTSVGDKSPELVESLKKGMMARILKQSKSPVLKGDTEELLLQPSKLATNISNILNNKTFANELFNEKELQSMARAVKDLRRISSVQKGSDNYSNTAYTLMKYMPLGLSDSLQAMVSRFSVADDVELATRQFLTEFEREAVGNKKLLGAVGVAPIAKDSAPFFVSADGQEVFKDEEGDYMIENGKKVRNF